MPISSKTPGNSRAVPVRAFLSCLLLASLIGACLGTPASALAQPKKKGKAAGSAPGYPPNMMPGSGPGTMPGSSGFGAPPTAGMPGYGSTMGSKKGNIQKKGPAERTKTNEPIDPEKLPPGYRVPPEPPDAMTTDQEWIENPFPEDKKGSQQKKLATLSKYKGIIGSGEFTGDDQRKFVADIIRYKLSLLTRKDARDKAYEHRQEILRDLNNSPTTKTGARDVRKFMLQTIAEEAPRLFKYHAVARINGAILLAELSDPKYNEADGDGNRKAAEPCIRALKPLQELVQDKKQITPPRIWGVIGLVRLGELPELKPQLRTAIVETLVEVLRNSADDHEWLQWRLVEGLGTLNVIADANKVPVVPQELARVLADTERPLLVRSEAALSLGRLPLTADIDAGLIAYEIALLARQMADAYDKQPDVEIWKLFFMKLYGAFKPLDAEQKRALLTQCEKGALASYKRPVQEAFDVVLPVVKKVVIDREGMDTALAGLRKWLDSNTPKNFKIHPDLEPIIVEEPIVKNKPDVVTPGSVNDAPANAGVHR
jgi:hypothetical protein